MKSFSILLIAVFLLSNTGCTKKELTPREQAMNEFLESNWDRSIELCDQIIAAEPTDLETVVLRGRAKLAKGDTDKAIEDFSAAIELAPKNPEPYQYRSTAYGILGQEKLAWADKQLSRDLDGGFKRTVPFVLPSGGSSIMPESTTIGETDEPVRPATPFSDPYDSLDEDDETDDGVSERESVVSIDGAPQTRSSLGDRTPILDRWMSDVNRPRVSVQELTSPRSTGGSEGDYSSDESEDEPDEDRGPRRRGTQRFAPIKPVHDRLSLKGVLGNDRLPLEGSNPSPVPTAAEKAKFAEPLAPSKTLSLSSDPYTDPTWGTQSNVPISRSRTTGRLSPGPKGPVAGGQPGRDLPTYQRNVPYPLGTPRTTGLNSSEQE